MRTATASASTDARFDIPPVFAVAERRMAGQALDLWTTAGGEAVPGFDAHSLVVIDPAGMALIETVGEALASAFGLAVGMLLDSAGGLTAEIRAACSLVAVGCQPVPFEAALPAPGRAVILARGIALPIGVLAGQIPERVQVIVNWRELLDRAATTRLQRELGAALGTITHNLARIDPFLPKSPN